MGKNSSDTEEKQATREMQALENQEYSWIEGLRATAEIRDMKDPMIIADTTIYKNSRDTTKSAEPPPTSSTVSSKKYRHGYPLARSQQSPSTVYEENPMGTNDLERELCSYMNQTMPRKEVKDKLVKSITYVDEGETTSPVLQSTRVHITGTLSHDIILGNDYDIDEPVRQRSTMKAETKLTGIMTARATKKKDRNLEHSPLRDE